ncbi:MAG: hypothetical protein HOG49_28745 [Candidatus Scalindua sp.]|jgi:hypothetical protein|nr:hypothetical protein [Candidatus Scalindua sp.]
MKNDLTQIEKDLLKSINFFHDKRYNYKNLMEWGNIEEKVRANLQEGEIIYKALDLYVAIKP